MYSSKKILLRAKRGLSARDNVSLTSLLRILRFDHFIRRKEAIQRHAAELRAENRPADSLAEAGV